jgi:hypothetical protein
MHKAMHVRPIITRSHSPCTADATSATSTARVHPVGNAARALQAASHTAAHSGGRANAAIEPTRSDALPAPPADTASAPGMLLPAAQCHASSSIAASKAAADLAMASCASTSAMFACRRTSTESSLCAPVACSYWPVKDQPQWRCLRLSWPPLSPCAAPCGACIGPPLLMQISK